MKWVPTGLGKLGPPVLAAGLFALSYFVFPGTGASDVQRMPEPGESITLHLINRGLSLRVHDRFALAFEQKVAPSTGVDMPDRPAVPCRIRVRITGTQGNHSDMMFARLHHAAENNDGGTAFFSSDSFEVPAGKSSAEVSNLDCAAGVPAPVGSLSMSPMSEHLMPPIIASLLRFFGWVTIALWALTLVAGWIRRRWMTAPQ